MPEEGRYVACELCLKKKLRRRFAKNLNSRTLFVSWKLASGPHSDSRMILQREHRISQHVVVVVKRQSIAWIGWRRRVRIVGRLLDQLGAQQGFLMLGFRFVRVAQSLQDADQTHAGTAWIMPIAGDTREFGDESRRNFQRLAVFILCILGSVSVVEKRAKIVMQ